MGSEFLLLLFLLNNPKTGRFTSLARLAGGPQSHLPHDNSELIS